MIPILSAHQIRQWDAYTIAHEPITSIDLMERACRAFVDWFIPRYPMHHSIDVVCGTGNNGGDGLGIARMLASKGYHVAVWIIGEASPSEDFQINQARVPASVVVRTITDSSTPLLTPSAGVVIDALFGSGLSRAITGIYSDVIKKINESNAVVVSVDVPSGLRLDQPSSGSIVHADHTVTFQAPKLAFLFPQNSEYVGDWHVVDIGLSKDFLATKEGQVNQYYVDELSLQKRKKFAHKGDYGRALLIAGGYGKMGAAVLSARAALRSGVGLLTVHVPKCGYDIIQTSVPEAMATVDKDEFNYSEPGDITTFDVIGVGPGLGIGTNTVNGLRKALEAGKPMVLDADALNILSQNRGLLHLVPAGSVLTPHPGEFERLVGRWSDDFDRLARQVNLAHQLKSAVVLKGAHTSVASPDGTVYFNSTGNPGMAKGGSGDVLTGVILALLSQGYDANNAAVLGVYFHGKAGDLAAEETGEYSLLASDIVDFLGQSFGH